MASPGLPDIVQAVIDYLKADTELAAYGVPALGDHIYRVGEIPSFPQFPVIEISKVDNLRGDHTSTSKNSTTRIQCTITAKNDPDADGLTELVGHRLDCKTNTAIGTAYIIQSFDAGVTSDHSPKIPLYVYHRDFRIMYSVRI
ncbi:MAG: hypothetical protein EHM40_21255 [Chloroflexi bacterium]|nr:MAG: hypothetical protein EHM40_21255 [Chloroflexota bacterium]